MAKPERMVTYTRKLQDSIVTSEIEAKKLFGEVLINRDKVDRTRNALSILSRFKFLFCLPSSIVKNIEKGDYDVVINDYIRVKNLFERSEVPIFQAALAEINSHIERLIIKLHEELKTMPIGVEQQKRLIRHLINLDCTFDPSWDAVKSRADYIDDNIKSVFASYRSGKRKKRHNQDSIPAHIACAMEICRVVSDNFPDFWRVGQAYFNSELQSTVDTSKTEDIKNIIMSLMRNFCESVRSAVVPDADWSNPDPRAAALYLPEVLRSVRSTYATLIKLDLPRDALGIVSDLLLDLRIHCMAVLFKQTVSQIELLKEDWQVLIFDKQRRGITNLPVKFERLVEDVIQIVKESVLSNERGDGSLLEHPQALAELHRQMENVLMSFHDVVRDLSNDDEEDEYEDEISLQHSQRKLLIVLSNCSYAKNVVLENVFKRFVTSLNRARPDKIIETIAFKLGDLEKSILEKYLERKSDPLVGTIEPSMYGGRFDWDSKATPNDIKPYAKECINNLIHVHAEICSISPSLLEVILPQVVQIVAEELYRLMTCARKFSKEGAIQATVDILVLRECLAFYSTQKAIVHFQDALDVIPKLGKEDEEKVEEILRQVRAKMRIQMSCLNATDDSKK